MYQARSQNVRSAEIAWQLSRDISARVIIAL